MNRFYLDRSIKLLVCDMAGTTVNEGGIVYKTLYNTIKGYDIYIKPEEMKDWYGVNKTEVLQHFIKRDSEYRYNETILPQMLNSFKQKLKKSYFEDNAVKLMMEFMKPSKQGYFTHSKYWRHLSFSSGSWAQFLEKLNKWYDIALKNNYLLTFNYPATIYRFM